MGLLELAVSGTGQPLASSHRDLPTTCTQYSKALNNLHIGKYLCIWVALCLFYLKTGSAILLKIQNILLEYEKIIEREKNRYTTVWREVKKLESEKEESQLIAEKTQDLKSILAHQEVEWKSDIQSLKYVTLRSDNVLSCQCSCSRRR